MTRRPAPHRPTNALIAAAVVLVASASLARADEAVHAQLSGTKLHVTATVEDGASTQLMVDADGDANTGLRLGDHGFDAMVENAIAYRFKGADPAAWSWEQSGAATRTLAGKKLTIDVDAALLPGKSKAAAVVLRSLSADFQTVTATVAAPAVDLSGAPAAKAPAAAAAPAASGLTATVAQDGGDLVVKLTAKNAADLNTTLVFLDADGDAATGFAPPADPRFGFEAMIQGASLMKHGGATRDAWAWTTLSPVKQTTQGTTTELRFDAAKLSPKKLKVAAWQMSPNWETRVDAWPKSADGLATTSDVPIDATKLRAAAPRVEVPIAARHANADLPARQRFAAAKSYACYYGAGEAGPLSHVDAAILHVPAQTAASVAKLNAVGVVTIGYVSVGEDEKIRPGDGTGVGGNASWYFDKDKDGKPDANGIWGSTFANAGDPAWRADRVKEARRLCDEVGFQGVFLDTVDTVDVYPASREGMIKLVEEFRAAMPDKVIVVNRGFTVLGEPRVAGNIDGVMFEGFSTTYDFDKKIYGLFRPQDLDATRLTMTSTVMPAMKTKKFQVLALDYCEPDQADRIQFSFDRAASFGMLPAMASIPLDAIYDTSKVVARPDPKYLEVMATPEAMQTTLDAPRNGFPAGTIVRPSSTYLSYSVGTVVDGLADHANVIWNKAAWASAEEPGVAQQLAFVLPEPIAGGGLAITFAYDDKTWFPSRDFSVDVSADGETWKTVAHPTANAEHTFRCPLPAEPYRQIRVVQSPGGGSAARPNLMWVQQVTRTP